MVGATCQNNLNNKQQFLLFCTRTEKNTKHTNQYLWLFFKCKINIQPKVYPYCYLLANQGTKTIFSIKATSVLCTTNLVFISFGMFILSIFQLITYMKPTIKKTYCCMKKTCHSKQKQLFSISVYNIFFVKLKTIL